METDFLVGGQPHIAVDGNYISVAVILKEKVGLRVSRGLATREMAQLPSLTKWGFVPEVGGAEDKEERRGWGWRTR